MAIEIMIPKLGMTMENAKVVEWKASEGEHIKEKQVVLVIQTDKVTYEVEALGSGFLHIVVNVGEEADVGQVVGVLFATKEELATAGAQAVPAGGAAKETVTAETSSKPVDPQKPIVRSERVKITPRAKKFAEAKKLDYTMIQGSGPGGRIEQKDVERALAAGSAAPLSVAGTKPAFTGEMLGGKRVKKEIPLQGMRKAISEHMLRSLQVSAQITGGTEVDMSEMIRFRNSQKKKAAFLGANLSYTDIFVYILAKVLKEQPIMNASLVDGKIVLWEDINVGVAVSTLISEYESGLAVPVVKNADCLSLSQISQSVRQMVVKTREGKLSLEDMSGGTFTLTNTGTFGSRWQWATPVLNQPEVGIIQTGATVDRVVAVNGVATVKPMMPLILTFDHRVIDGFGAARFANRVADLIEDPYQLVD